jgi:SAM-dependent methyltransferase
MRDVNRVYNFLKRLPIEIKQLQKRLDNLERSNKEMEPKLDNVILQTSKQILDLSRDVEHLQTKQSDILHAVNAINRPSSKSTIKNTSDLQAYNHALDGYYVAFEEKFRGSEKQIKDRLSLSYSKVISRMPESLKKKPAVDIGCGRGELLELFKENGLKPIGVDLNRTMVELCKKKGFEAYEADGLQFLLDQPTDSLSCISGIHLVEHIGFDELMALVNEAYRALAPGGFVLFETPNSENLTVGAYTFWFDSSHLKPIPPLVMEFILEYVGFNASEVTPGREYA